ncbi:translation elongation factor EF-1alpha (GTPase) HBS1 isoform X2 [Rhodnius prolixus]|uniref:translation elongation factor EF-1alpha (GTPase) HBS1 isoform X2 n=1 Tax=Rhodnius prolixus TaxID=13249 RepID=UPI003D18AFA4
MSRHRNVRSMNYSDEYDGYDDVYGHSVEDDYTISPSDAAFMYDRNSRQPQMSLYLKNEEDIAEEDEQSSSDPSIKQQSEVNQEKLTVGLEQIKNILGDSFPEELLINMLVEKNYDTAKVIDVLLNNTSFSKRDTAVSPKPQRLTSLRSSEKARTPVVTVSSPAKSNVIKGFLISDDNNPETIKDTNQSSRSASPTVVDKTNPDAIAQKVKISEDVLNISKRNIAKAEEHFKEDRGSCKEQLHMVVTGHVDAGKSTLMGHLLFKLGHVSSKTMHKYEQESKKLGKQSFIYAWILDETGEERSRGITMDVGQSKFETKNKIVTLLDAPGHKDFIPNMITGAAQADVALLVVDSTRGEFETGFESGGQTREHALLVRSLGVNQLCVVINKLDTVDWSEERFLEISVKMGTFLKQAGFKEKDVTFVPCSGLTGENLIERSSCEKLLKWYKGPTLLEVIDKFKCPERPVSKPLRVSVNDIYKGTGSGFCVSGRVESGMVQVGDKVLVQPQNELALIKAITIDELPSQKAFAGDYISLTLANFDQQNIAIGYILSDPAFPTAVSSKFESRVVVFNTSVPITRGYPVVLHMQSLSEQAVISKLVAQLNKSTGDIVKQRPRCLLKNSSAMVIIETSKPVCIELYRDMKELGRFMLRVSGVTIAAGVITKIM